MTIPYLYRHAETGYFEPRPCAYDGPVSLAVWKRLNRQFLKLEAGNYFYPCDGADAYAEAITRVCETAERIERGEIVLEKASADTYLTGVAFKTLCRFHLREVMPRRDVYRRVEDLTVGNGAVGEDGFDIDNYDGTKDMPDKTMTDACGEPCTESIPIGSAMTAQQLVEALPGNPSYSERRDIARALLEDLYTALGDAVCVSAFRAYVTAEGVFPEAARLIHVSQATYYRNWPVWIALAKNSEKKTPSQGTN